jgi:Salmonella virulence plasmid 65kDa B protein
MTEVPTNRFDSQIQAGQQEDDLSRSTTISLPKGGGALRGIGEKFSVNPVTGTGSLTLPIFSSAGRSGFSPQLSLSYDFPKRMRYWPIALPLRLPPFIPWNCPSTSGSKQSAAF